MLKRLLHTAILVDDFEKGIKRFEGMGLFCKEVIEIKELGVKIGLFPMGDTSLEMICFTDPEKGKDSIVWKHKSPLNHICFEVDNIEESIRDFEKNGVKLVEGYPKKGAHGLVAFFYPETTEDVLIEICQF